MSRYPPLKPLAHSFTVKLDPLDPSDLQPPLFPKKDKNSPNTLTIPARSSLTKRERIYQALWKLQARVRENDIKYAFKVGLGTGKSLGVR